MKKPLIHDRHPASYRQVYHDTETGKFHEQRRDGGPGSSKVW